MANERTWLPIESDPDSLNAFLRKLGQHKLRFVDVFGFQEDLLALTPQPVHALLLLYPISDEKSHNNGEKEHNEQEHHVWFIKQTIPNACGTIALLHLLGNLRKQFPLEKNSVADLFFEKVHDMSPDDRAKELEKNEAIHAIHQSFAESGTTEVGDLTNIDTHYIVFLEVNGCLFKLDGRTHKPVVHGFTTTDTLLKDAAKIIETNYVSKATHEHRFAAFALTSQPEI